MAVGGHNCHFPITQRLVGELKLIFVPDRNAAYCARERKLTSADFVDKHKSTPNEWSNKNNHQSNPRTGRGCPLSPQ